MRIVRWRRSLGLLATVLLVLGTVGCSRSGPGPEEAARQFLATLVGGDANSAAAQTDAEQSAKVLLDKVRTSLKPLTATGQVDTVQHSAGSATATAHYSITWDFGPSRKWTYDNQFELLQDDDENWKVRWAPDVLHPKLAEQQSIVMRAQQPDLAPVLDRDGLVLLEPDRVVSVLLDPAKAGELNAVAGKLAAALSRFDASITAGSIVAGAGKAPRNQPYQVVVLRDGDYEQVKSQIYELPGVRFTSAPRLLPSDKTLAPQLLPGLRKLVEDQVGGTSGWRVVTVDENGGEVEELFAKAAQPAQAVHATLSTKVQNAAQAAIAAEPTPAMIVAMRSSTGELLAVAQNPPADKQGPIALTGRYPPGSTFKIVTAAAALAGGTVAAATPVGCPGTTTIEGRVIPNSDKFDKGTIPLHSAFAFSCNTTFASLAVGMGPDTLTDMARRLGIGVDFVLPGITTITGSVPPAGDTVERAEDGFGQGKVVASPFGMALAAATVATGSMPVPTLLRGTETKVDGRPQPVPGPVLDAVRAMMREVVTSGTATALAALPEVRGKTGTAQFGDGTHAHGWFVGYQGDLAFAVLITDSGASTGAVAATGRFLAALR